MRRKEGFTLIELLAVIAILAILLLLAVPRVIEIYHGVKRDNFRNESLSIVTSAETKYMAQAIADNTLVDCFEYNKDNNELNGFMEYKEGYTGKILLVGDNMSINITNGEYTITGLTKKNVDNVNNWEFLDEDTPEFSKLFSCNPDDLFDIGINVIEPPIDPPAHDAIWVEAHEDTLQGMDEITYEFSKDDGATWEFTENPTSPIYFFDELTPDTTYQIKVRISHDGVVLETSDSYPVTTDALTEPTISLSSSSKTYNSVNLIATASDYQTELKTNTYQFSKDNGVTWTPVQSMAVYTFTGLSANTTYTFKARVQNNGGLTGTSTALSVTTNVLTEPMISLTSSSKTHNSVSLTAIASDNQTGIKAGTYQFSKDNGVTWTALQSGATYTFTGLTASTTYNFKTRVQNNGGLTKISDTLPVTTLEPPSKNLKDDLIAKNPIKPGTPNFSQNSSAGDTGLWSAPDDYGTSYYFRGNKELLNNNVIFGGYQWKVIRITGSGNIRLIYNGTCANNSCAINSIGASTALTATGVFNSSTYGENRYVGYMYGSSCGTYAQCHSNTINSTVKTAIDSFYSGIRQSAKNLIADTIHCNDRKVASGSGVGEGGYGSPSYYAARNSRLMLAKSPSLICPQKNDAFTVSDTTKGNGALTYPVGMITADEAAMAGAVSGNEGTTPSNTTYYLYTGVDYWTMTPGSVQNNTVFAYLVRPEGGLEPIGRVRGASGLRPVMALKSTVQATGSGTVADPYVIVE